MGRNQPPRPRGIPHGLPRPLRRRLAHRRHCCSHRRRHCRLPRRGCPPCPPQRSPRGRHRQGPHVQHVSAFTESRDGSYKDSKVATNYCETTYTLATGVNAMDFTIEFADKPGQTGVQCLMEVDINKRGAGSFPVSGGIAGASSYSVAEMNFNTNLGNLSELAECSDRGLDDGDGQCECFDGFRGLACEEQEALV